MLCVSVLIISMHIIKISKVVKVNAKILLNNYRKK